MAPVGHEEKIEQKNDRFFFFHRDCKKVKKNFNCCNIGKSGSSTFGLKLLKAFLDYFAKIGAKSSFTMENIIDWEHRMLSPTSETLREVRFNQAHPV